MMAVNAFVANALAQISLPKILGHDMVLQRNQPVPIWGYASAGEQITVAFASQKKQTIADATGNWKLMLDAMDASSKSRSLTITGKNTIVLNDVLVGEVWLCSGQSNMEYTMRKNSKVTVPPGKNWPVDELDHAHNPAIRIFLVDRKKMKPDPTHQGWSVAEDSALRSFSAVGYFFAKKLYEELHIPIGVIGSSIPGSRIEPWAPESAFRQIPFFKDSNKIDGEPGKFYTTMIEPLAPFALKGFLWYQGESNCFLNDRIEYTYKMEALINNWRTIWNNKDMPFYYVEIAPFAYTSSKGKITYNEQSLPEFREAQALAMQIPHTGMVVTTDLNDSINNLHPHFKWEIGRRLALWALAKDYQIKSIQPSGPIYKDMKVVNDKAIIEFTNIGSGLEVKGDNLTCFTIAGKDGNFFAASAIIKGDKVIVSSPEVSSPTTVRLGWNEADHPNLYNKNGLPAVPFRTDNPLKAAFKISN